MLSRYDAVLVAIPVLAASGLVLRTAVAATGIATGLLSIPLAPAGFLAAFGLVLRELLFGPVAAHASDDRT
ncbi:hypothetical protein ACFOZ7_17940 [Natribaculum luteum]|uniref:Uncharacterized protein n=1 Tax=Natribaculum luteum TaxID=1586232 RepID=A0ABD5P3N1_9EURY|nr:hypothetical protein [Natribaculum luteum]